MDWRDQFVQLRLCESLLNKTVTAGPHAGLLLRNATLSQLEDIAKARATKDPNWNLVKHVAGLVVNRVHGIEAGTENRPHASNQRSAANCQQPANSRQQPATSSQQPAASSQQPQSRSQQQAASSQPPAAYSQ